MSRRIRPAFSVVGHQPHGMFPCEGEGKASAMSALIRLLWVFFVCFNFRILASSVKAACLISLFSLVRLFATAWTLAHQTPLSMGLSRQESWSGLPCPPPRDLSSPGVEPMTSVSPALTGRFSTAEPWGKPLVKVAAAAAKSLQSGPTRCDPIDGSSPGFPVPEILQARTLEWVAISFSNA